MLTKPLANVWLHIYMKTNSLDPSNPPCPVCPLVSLAPAKVSKNGFPHGEKDPNKKNSPPR